MKVTDDLSVVGSSTGHGIFLCLKKCQFFLLCITLLSILAHPFTDCDQKKILWPFSKIWEGVSIFVTFMHSMKLCPKKYKLFQPRKIVSQIIEKCKGHDLYYWNIDVGHSSLNVLCILIFLIFCLFTLQWYRKSWPLAFLQLF